MGSVLYQFIAVICVNLITIGYGSSVGWMTSAFLVLESDDSPLPTGKATMPEIAWIGSILGIGGLVGTILMGQMADRLGRKNSLLMTAFPHIISLLLLMYAQNVYYLYLSRFLLGIVGGCIYIAIPIMVAEIAEDTIRGTLCTILVLASNGGVLLGFIFGHFLAYEQTPRISIIFPILFLIFYSFMPETPYYLMHSNRLKDAERSLRFYRNVKEDSTTENKSFEYELTKLQYAHVELKKQTNKEENQDKLKIKDFACRSMTICLICMMFHEFNGCFTMMSYASIIFAQSGSSLSPTISAIIVGVIQFIGSYVSTMLVDRLGRRILMVFSFAGTGICHVILGTYIYLSMTSKVDLTAVQWIPVASFSMMLFVASCGALPIPYVILSEILPDKIRSVGSTLCLCLSWTLTFLLGKGFTPIVEIIELYGCIYFFAFCCFAAVSYILLNVPETKGKSLEEILLILKS